jgi:transmembrane sensor
LSAGSPSTEVLEQAADWFFRVRSADVDADVHSQWLVWIEADPAHRAAFAEVQQTWDTVGSMEAPPAERVQIVSDRAPAKGSPGWLRSNGWRAMAAGVLVAGVLGVWLAGDLGPHEKIVTGRGEQQSTVLSDGSRVELGGLTAIEVQFTAERRVVVADEGEAFYRVSHDPKRPFVVEAGPVRVTAIGTAFSVRREGGRVSVVVNEGIVDVAEKNGPSPGSGTAAAAPVIRVKAGQRVQYDGEQLSAAARALSTEPGSVWRRGLLRFEDEPLATVVASLNRYSPRRIVLQDHELESLRFTGTVYDDSVDDWLAGVGNLYPVEVSGAGEGPVVIRRRD